MAREAFLSYFEDVRLKPASLVTYYNSWWTLPPVVTHADDLALVLTLAERLRRRHGTFLDFITTDMGWSETGFFVIRGGDGRDSVSRFDLRYLANVASQLERLLGESDLRHIRYNGFAAEVSRESAGQFLRRILSGAILGTSTTSIYAKPRIEFSESTAQICSVVIVV